MQLDQQQKLVPDESISASTARSSDETKVPVSEWNHGDQANPYNWPVHRKWLFNFVTAASTLSVSFASSGYTGALSNIVEHFNVSRNVAMLGLTLYVVGFAAGPLVWAPLSEVYGRRPIFLVSHLPFALFCLGSALARHVTVLLITRFLAGLFGGCMMVVGGAMVADVWGPKERGLATSIFVPFTLLFTEAIVIPLAIWISFAYGTLYLFFGVYPLVFQADRPKGYGMGAGIGALPFLGIGVGMVMGTGIAFITDKQYIRRMDSSKEAIAPEARLPPACVGAVCLPISLALFAATSDPSIHWIAPTLAGIPFGTGLVLIFVSVLSYLIDTYGIYCASALGANAVLRSLFAAAFPMFATKMYEALGQRWATGVLAFFALACLPLPFVFYRYGATIRRKSRFASRADH